MKIKKLSTAVFAIFSLVILIRVVVQFYRANNIEQTCFNSDFTDSFNKANEIELNDVYDFSKIFNCENWDDIIIVGGNRANSTIIFLWEGVALPPIEYDNILDGTLVLFLIKDGKLVSSPISIWQQHFLYFKDFNSFDYVSFDREKAKFKCVELETIGPVQPILTFQLVD